MMPLAAVSGPAASPTTNPSVERKWVDAWAASYLPTTVNGTPQAVPVFSNQTLRLNMFLKLGGPAVRVKLSNRFATQPLMIGGAHVAVARDLRDDRRRGDRGALRVAVDDRPVGRRGWTQPEAVDEVRLGHRVEIAENRAKTTEIRAVQADTVDLARRDHAHRDRGGAADDRAEQLLSGVRRDLLGVVQRGERANAMTAEMLVVEHHARDDERPRQRAAPRLVGACDVADVELSIEPKEPLTR